MRLLYSNWSHSGLCSFHTRSNEAESMQCMGVRSVTGITEVNCHGYNSDQITHLIELT